MTTSAPDKLLDALSIFSFRRRRQRRDQKYATFNRRMIAATLDSLILMIFAPVFDRLVPIHTQALMGLTIDPNDPNALRKLVIGILNNNEFMTSWVSNFMAQVLVMCVFSAVCWHFWSATPGKMLVRIKVVDARTEGPPSDRQIVIRALGYLVSGLCFFLGFMWIGINKRHRGWHDWMADTAVIVVPWRQPEEAAEKPVEMPEASVEPSPVPDHSLSDNPPFETPPQELKEP